MNSRCKFFIKNKKIKKLLHIRAIPLLPPFNSLNVKNSAKFPKNYPKNIIKFFIYYIEGERREREERERRESARTRERERGERERDVHRDRHTHTHTHRHRHTHTHTDKLHKSK